MRGHAAPGRTHACGRQRHAAWHHSLQPAPAAAAGHLRAQPPRRAPPCRAAPPEAAAATRDALAGWKVAQLQAALQSLQLPKSGKKEVLVERLLQGLHARDAAAGSAPQPGDSLRGTSASASGRDEEGSSSSSSSSSSRQASSAGASTSSSMEGPVDPAGPASRRARGGRAAAAAVRGCGAAAVERDALACALDPPAPPVALADTSALPPMHIIARGSNWGVHESSLPPEKLKVLVGSNPTDMQLAFLGTAAFAPHAGRALASLALVRGKDVWIFDAGDDLQRQLGALPCVRPSKVFRILISRLTPECVLGLPGLVCTLGASRARGHAHTDIPVHLYGPPGVAEYLNTVFKVSNTYQEISLVAHELVPHAVSEQDRLPTLLNKRARLFRALVPPDHLNPRGATDGSLDGFMPTEGRATSQKGHHAAGGVLAHDPRAGFLPFPPPTPGDPTRRDAVPLEALTWSVQVDVAAQLTAVALPPHEQGLLTLGCVIQEADRLGTLLVDRARQLGVEPGWAFSALKDGHTVQNARGEGVTHAMCVTAPKPGRKLAIMGSAAEAPGPASAFVRLAQGADVLVTGAVGPSAGGGVGLGFERGARAAAMGELAARLGADRLMLGRLDLRCLEQGQGAGGADAEAAAAEQLRQEAAAGVAALGGACTVSVAHDFWLHVLEKHEGPGPRQQ